MNNMRPEQTSSDELNKLHGLLVDLGEVNLAGEIRQREFDLLIREGLLNPQTYKNAISSKRGWLTLIGLAAVGLGLGFLDVDTAGAAGHGGIKGGHSLDSHHDGNLADVTGFANADAAIQRPDGFDFAARRWEDSHIILKDTNALAEGAADIVEPHAIAFQSEADISWGDHFGNPNFDRVDYVDHGQNILTDRMFEIAAFSMADAGVNIDPATMSSIMFVDTVSARSSSRDGRVLNRELMGQNGSILIGTDDDGQSYAIFGSDDKNRSVGVDLNTSSYNVVKIYRGEGERSNVLGYKDSKGELVPLVTVTKEGDLEVMVPIKGDSSESATVGGKPNFSPVSYKSESELNPVFSPETWAGTDQLRLDFVNTLDMLGYPRKNVTCDDKGDCFDLDGDVIARNGIFLLQFAKDAAIKYGNPISTQYGPATGNVLAGTSTRDVTTFVTVPLLASAREKNRQKSLNFDLGEGNQGTYKTFMLSEETKSWAIEYFRDRKDPNAPKYFIFEKEDKSLVIVPVS